ncbi:MAG: hypothetical protein HN348_03915 [Proteobacteria bacterium]|nr:hypothetical protein [Pseudomonadota bacterium]
MFSTLLGGCWNTDTAALSNDTVDFDPHAAEIDGWVVEGIDVNLECPDGKNAVFYIVYPSDVPDSPQAAAVVYHSGSFDFVTGPTAEDPTAGAHYQDQDSRLGTSWAIHRVFVTLGMYPNDDPYERHEGSLPYALADAGVPMLFPINCWGDYWHNRAGVVENDFTGDLFYRNGRVAAEWGYRLLAEESFGITQRIELPITVDPTKIYAVGLGEGARAIGELITIDDNLDGTPDFMPAAIAVDSVIDDLRVFYDNEAIYSETVQGLNRIFVDGKDATQEGSLGSAPVLPNRTAYIYSSVDTLIPVGAHDQIIARLSAMPDAWVHDATLQRHVLLNGAEEVTLAKQVVEYLTSGTGPTDTSDTGDTGDTDAK